MKHKHFVMHDNHHNFFAKDYGDNHYKGFVFAPHAIDLNYIAL
jgi:hypothetical protein